MDQKKILKPMIDFNQASFNTSFNAVLMLQEPFEKTTRAYSPGTPGCPKRGSRSLRTGWPLTATASFNSKAASTTPIERWRSISRNSSGPDRIALKSPIFRLDFLGPGLLKELRL
jgi:hypothetical protein